MTKVQEKRRAGRLARAAAGLAAGILVAAAATASARAACAPEAAGGAVLEVQVRGLRSADGLVTITVYPDDPDRFMASGGKVSRLRVPAVKPVTSACVQLPKPGTYAIAVYHDENKDRKFNRSMLGLPTEGYGFSRNPTGLIGIPSLSEVSFSAQAGSTPLAIDLAY